MLKKMNLLKQRMQNVWSDLMESVYNKLNSHEDHIKYALCAGLILFSAMNLALLYSFDSDIEKQANFKFEQNKLPEINITRLTVKNCDDCFDTDIITGKLSSIKIIKDKYIDVFSAEGKELINKYGIVKAPTVILQGDVNKMKSLLDGMGNFIDNNAFVYTKLTPVLLDIKTGTLAGRINATIIVDSSCSDCIDLSQAVENLNKSGMSVRDIKTIDISNEKSKILIEKYNISIAPTVIFSKDMLEYSDLMQAFLQIGTIEQDGSFVLRAVSPPYRNLSINQIIGRVEMINIVDLSCDECYNVTINKQILQNEIGVFIKNETTYSINSSKGMELLNKYNITKVPAFLLSSQASAYPNLMTVWSSVGTVESDGWFVFRNIRAIKNAVYKDLQTNETMDAGDE